MSVSDHASNQSTQQKGGGQATPEREQLGEGHIMGNLTHDPELRFTPAGTAVASLRVAYTQRVRVEGTDQWRDLDPEFYDVQVWRDQGTRAAENLRRGDRIVAAGQWVREHYISRDGEPKSTVRLVARDLGASMLFRNVWVDRSNGRRPAGSAGVPIAAPRPEGQRPAANQPADDPWAGETIQDHQGYPEPGDD